MDDMGKLTSEQIVNVDGILRSIAGAVEGALPQLAANLIITEFEVGQTKADAWAEYSAMKLRESKVEATVIALATSDGVLEGRNPDERKRKLDMVKSGQSILDAKTITLSMRNMSDCLTNAHASVRYMLALVMALIEGQK